MNIQFSNNALLTQSCLPPDEWDPWRLSRYTWPLYPIIRDREPTTYESWEEGRWHEYPESIVKHALENLRSKDGDEDQGDFDPSRWDDKIEDPLAYYVPYPVNYNQASNSRWGIYFRVTKMLTDFKKFHSRLPALMPVELSWRVYVSTVFWHEMAHHVVQDLWLLQEGLRFQTSAAPSPSQSQHYSCYTLMPRSDEEGFCEYMAFSAVERGYSIPRFAFCIYPDYARGFSPRIPLLPRGSAARPDELRAHILCALYDHWGRAQDPDYSPRVTERASESVGPLWLPCWESHRRGVPVINSLWACDLIWDRIFVTDK